MLSFSVRKVIVAAITAVAMLIASCLTVLPVAWADDDLDSLEARVEETARAYNEAVAAVDEIDARISENQEKIEALEQTIESQKDDSNEALRSLYKYQQTAPTLISLLLTSDSATEVFDTMDLISRYQEYNMDILNEQQRLMDELEAANTELESDKESAQQARSEAEKALSDAQLARQEAMEQAEAEAAAQLAAEQEAELEAASAESSESSEASQSTEETSSETVTSTVSSSDVNWTMSYNEFIEEWTARIDAYLAGSPMAGQGRTFAEAAWNYGVDPRWSPAIAAVESSKGAYCFRSYNAWGWGSSSWSSWEEAIDAHVNGLARLYGYSLTLDAAKKYCPSNYSHWYNSVLSQMNSI